MKNILTSLLLALCTAFAFGQTSGGPDAYGYAWKNSNHATTPPVYNWVDISTRGTLVTGLADDNVVGPFTGSAGFQFYWYPTPEFWIGSNGYISFAGDNIASPFPASIPLSSGANNWIAPLLSDLNFTGAGNPGKCYIFSNADSLIVSYENVPFWTNATPAYTGSNTFQIILSKLDTSITFNYQSMSLGTLVTIDDAVGIENNTGTLGLSSIIDALPANNFTIRYYYPAVVTYSVTDGGVNWTGNDATGGSFVNAMGGGHQLSASVRNYGNQLLSNFTANSDVKNSSATTIVNSSANIASLVAGTNSTVTFPVPFVAPATGIYTHNVSLSGITGDLVASNDQRPQKLIAVDSSLALPSNPGVLTLNYSDDIADGGGLGWNGGDGGIGIYIEPSIYPARIVSSRFMISANTNSVGFHAKIYDDDGLNGGPGTLLDSVYVAPTSITLNVYTVVPTSQNVDVSEGGVYLLWYMDGANINLARDLTAPISRRTYEVLANAWAGYRDLLTEDFLLGIDVKYAPPVASFEIDSIDEPLMVFSDSSANIPDAWEWNFGDGSPVSNLQHPTYAYSDTGTYEVCLKVSNLAGSDSTCRSVHIDNVLPVADFSFDASASPQVSFTDLSSGALIASWFWDFDDLGTDTTSVQNPNYTFTTNATHNVCLTVVNHAGSNTACKDVAISGIGISEQTSTVGVSVYPNPFNDHTRIELDGSNDKTITSLRMYDATGRIQTVDYAVVGNAIDVSRSGLANGTYFFEVYAGSENLVRGRMMIH